jgi:ribose-phosphate pyrophosphokinase
MSNITFVDESAKIEWITFSDKTETCKIVPVKVGGGHLHTKTIGNHIQVNVVDATRDLIRIGLVKDALDRLGIDNVKLTDIQEMY